MSEPEVNIHVLDAAYNPFPNFEEWASRTSVDSVRWNRYRTALESKQRPSAEALRRAREIVKRAAALDTGAIEGLYEVDRGFTFTVARETAAWEVELAKRGDNVRPLFEAQMHAYDYVLDLATKKEPISEVAIRVLHEVVCRAQTTYRVSTAVGLQEQELPNGRYKALPNHVRTRDGADHSYAPVDLTPAEMQRLVTEMRGELFLAAHPVTQSAYAHYALVVIHPFADGNGRVARALASTFTYRAISMPIMILSEHKDAYLDALENADAGDYQTFVDFMLARSVDTLALVNESATGAAVPRPQDAVAALSGLYRTSGGYTWDEVDAGGIKLLDLLKEQLLDAISRHLVKGLTGRVFPVEGGRGPTDESHRIPIQGGRGITIRFNSAPPAKAEIVRTYFLFVPKDASGDDDIQIERGDGNEKFVARVDEIIPATSTVLHIRLSIFAERVMGEMLGDLRLQAEGSLRAKF
ncbi:MAG TPA: Fic family protein [Terracidiphilus sp.]|nr:Fic family protein [Terracidiphilus sp.]